jgi:anti-sigma regulatory factor (Ser/Thr protein kinase)
MDIERSWSLPDALTAPAAARRILTEVCAGLPRDALEIVHLLASELVANAIQHGTGEVQLVVRDEQGRLQVGVRDEAPGAPGPVTRGPDDVGGRGLMLIEALASEWGIEPRGTEGRAGKMVWFSLRKGS